MSMEAWIKSSGENLSSIDNIDQDLLLAAEIGKTLLEKNRELELLIKTSQELAEEHAAQADFYMKQVEILRESNDSCQHSCEVLESNNQALHDKYEQLQTEHKILQGKNTRLWELINSLEKRNEELVAHNSSLQQEVEKCQEEIVKAQRRREKEIAKEKRNSAIVVNGEDSTTDVNTTMTNKNTLVEETTNLRNEIETLKKIITDLKVQVNVEKWQKEELDSQLQDEIQDNQMLHHKIAELNKEILEWESFAQKEECYRRIAEAFTIKHNIEVEETLMQNMSSSSHFLSPGSLAKAKSCEFLVCDQPKRISTDSKQNIIKSSSVRKSLANTHKQSILSELDQEYDDLVKRYEALLEKCKQDGKFIENPDRTRKVQRAIQTLSLDFSKLTTPIQSPTKSIKTPPSAEKSHLKANSTEEGGTDDYKKLFSQIFEKLKESKEFSHG